MPNWCENEVNICGKEKDVKKFIELVSEKFDYNRISPMPDKLKGLQSPAKIISQQEYDEEQERIAKATGKEKEYFDMVGRGITQEMSDSFVKEYGFDNWYDWAVQNWGVKWTATDVQYDNGDTWANWAFMSPWSPPEPICMKLRELFPDVDIVWFFKEPGMQMSGWL